MQDNFEQLKLKLNSIEKLKIVAIIWVITLILILSTLLIVFEAIYNCLEWAGESIIVDESKHWKEMYALYIIYYCAFFIPMLYFIISIYRIYPVLKIEMQKKLSVFYVKNEKNLRIAYSTNIISFIFSFVVGTLVLVNLLNPNIYGKTKGSFTAQRDIWWMVDLFQYFIMFGFGWLIPKNINFAGYFKAILFGNSMLEHYYDTSLFIKKIPIKLKDDVISVESSQSAILLEEDQESSSVIEEINRYDQSAMTNSTRGQVYMNPIMYVRNSTTVQNELSDNENIRSI